MKIVYLISAVSSDNSGQGGHYYSAKSISAAMERAGNDVYIMVLGDFFPKAYDDIKDKVKYIEFTGFNYFNFFREVYRELKLIEPDCVHIFDNKSFFVARVNSFILGFGLVLTKPGGPNPTRFFPYCKNLVTFSEENKEYFSSIQKFKNAKIHFIPNRVEPFQSDDASIAEMRKKLPSNRIVITRIGRVGPAYKDVIVQTGNIVRYLNNKGIASIGAVVGVVEDEAIYEELKAEYLDEIVFFTSEKYTRNASRLIEVGEACIGTGRSLMEAACKSRVLLTTHKDSQYPVLLNSDNVNCLMKTNFSPRNYIASYSESDNLQAISEAFSSRKNIQSCSEYSEGLAKEYFELEAAVDKYEEVYKSSEKEKKMGLDMFLNLITYIYHFSIIK